MEKAKLKQALSAIKSAGIMIPAHHQMATGPIAKHQKHRNNISISRQIIQNSNESVETHLLQTQMNERMNDIGIALLYYFASHALNNHIRGSPLNHHQCSVTWLTTRQL